MSFVDAFDAVFADEAEPMPAVVAGDALAGPPLLLWSQPLPGLPPPTATRTEPAAPVVLGDRIFVGFSGADGLLVLSRHDGGLVTVLPARAPVATAPVVTDTFVYFSDTAGYTFAYRLDALDTRTPAWSHFSGAPVLSPVTVAGDTLYVANVDDLVFALDARTGELRWRHAHRLDAARTSELELFGAPSPVLDAARGELLCGFSDGFLVALGARDGTPRWSVGVGEGAYPDLIAPPAVGALGVLVGGYSGPLESLDPEARAVRWRLEVGSSAPFSVVGETLWHGGADGQLRRVDLRTGEVKWVWDTGAGGTLGQPVPTAQGLLVASSEASLYLVDPETGSPRWTFDPGVLLEGFTATPAVVGDTVYAVSNAGVLYAFRGRAPVAVTDTPDWVTPPFPR
ncbi:MAG: PQQ-binding-like beta-propeller repeat protein [Myxococcota bacterium]